jgi:hypothetical protein
MKSNLRVFFVLVMILVASSTSLPAVAKPLSVAVFAEIEFVANIETVGVAVAGAGLPSTAQLSYRQSGEATWRTGQPLVRIDDGRLIGSLFNLSPATSYDVKVFDGVSEINGSVSTQPVEVSFTPSAILYVDDNALPGGTGSPTAPYRTIQDAVNHAGPGTEVLVADGTYREAVTFPSSGTPGNWIQVKAAGNAAILDSADRLSGSIWTSTSTAKVWFTRISGPVAYLARGGNRFYQYDDKNGLMQSRGHGGVTINEGWFYEAGTQRLYVRSLENPVNYTWRVPRLNHAFDIFARDWIWIEGFEVRFYGTTTNGCGVCTLNGSHLVIRKNKIHNMQLGIFINWNGSDVQGNDTRIEENEIYDPLVNEWPWAATKGSYMEGTGIIVRGHIGAIVRDNNVHNFFNGIYTGSSGALENTELAFDADIYDNYIHQVSDDGLEPEGACVNQRFRNNLIDRSFIGLSVAPITQGPTWVLRNTIANFTGRVIKFADNSDGIVLIYHNTGWTTAPNINGADLITSIHNVKMRNNIFQTSGYSIYEVPTGSTGNDWNRDNWYTTRGAAGPHFKWENVNYNTISSLCAASGLECSGYENIPGFTNPTGGDFTLLSSSPNIDRGVAIPGINDGFVGNGPDVGAYESAFNAPPTVLSSNRSDPNPTGEEIVGFTVTFSKVVSGVDPSDFALATTSLTGASILSVNGDNKTYTVSINTGTGNGAIRLDVVDNDSIEDESGNPLGGVGAGNGDFRAGETYTIEKIFNVSIGIGDQGMGSYAVPYYPSLRTNFPNMLDGPVKVVDTYGEDIITSQRVVYGNSFNELMGYPADQFTTEYWFPWYDQVNMQTWILVGNPSATQTAYVEIYIGGTLRGSYTIPPNDRVTPQFAGVLAGPVQVVSVPGTGTPSPINIFASERSLYGSSFNEMIGYPSQQFTTEYWFPWYDQVNMQTWILVGNPSATQTAYVDIYISGIRQGNTYAIPANGRITPQFPGLVNGPVRVVSVTGAGTPSPINIFASERSLYGSSFNEVMGVPSSQFTTEYWYTWYDNYGMNSWILVGNPSSTQTAYVEIYIGGAKQGSTYAIPANGRITPQFNLNSGPVRVVSVTGAGTSSPISIFTSERSLYGPSFNEMMGYPTNQLTSEYWFTWYDSIYMNTDIYVSTP